MMEYNQNIVDTICDTLVKAGSSFLLDKKKAYTLAINKESNAHAKWVLQTVLQNAEVAERTRCPLCDDTGIPHILIEIGPNAVLTGSIIESIKEGVRQGLKNSLADQWLSKVMMYSVFRNRKGFTKTQGCLIVHRF